MQIHELFRPAVETMFSTGIEVAMKSVKDQLRVIGVDPDEAEPERKPDGERNP